MKRMDDLTMPTTTRRREGFPGQHHCVLPPDVAARAARHPLLRGLLPTDAGLYPRAAGHYVVRAKGAPGTVLLLCCLGRGWIKCRGARIPFEAGDVALLPPNEPHAYGADDAEPWTLEWAHYAGEETPAWRTLILQDSPVATHIPAARVGEVNLAAVHERLEAGYGDFQLLSAAAALRSSLTEIARLRRVPGTLATAVEAVDASAQWMRGHLDRRISLAELAQRACLSPSHYSAVFRRRHGYAPIDWLIRQRIHRACSMLQSHPDKISVIAASVGIEDPYYFSRVFRKVMGVSPEKFRATH